MTLATIVATGALAAAGACRGAPVTAASRTRCLAAASLTREAVALDPATLGRGPAPSAPPIAPETDVYCRFAPKRLLGVSLKFFCYRTDAAGTYYDDRGRPAPDARSVGPSRDGVAPLLDARRRPLRDARGRIRQAPLLKVKYLPPGDAAARVVGHWRYREVMTEVAATRILWALGFYSDSVYAARRVLCRGCLRDPFRSRQASVAPGDSEFPLASVEYRLPGATIERREEEGWTLAELASLARGDREREREVGLLLLAAGVLNLHHIPEAKQNRIVCPPDGWDDSGACRAPFAYFDDVGGTFGGGRRDGMALRGELATYERHRVFADPARCRLTIAPRGFETIDEPTRAEFARRAGRNLSPSAVRAILAAARFDLVDEEARRRARVADPAGAVAGIDQAVLARWQAAIEARLREIAEARCPGASRI